MVAVEVERMLRLAEQCLERAKSFIGKNTDPPLPPSSTPVHTGHKASSPTKTGHRRVLSDGGGELSPFLPPEVFQRLQTVEAQNTSKKELTPIEQASRLNQKLKANYEARLARLTPGQACQKTSLTLSLQRQMMENLIIAKARQEALQRKMEERRLRLQEEANRRFAASGGMTAEEQEQRTLYASVLEYEQDHVQTQRKPIRTVSTSSQSFSTYSSLSSLVSHNLHTKHNNEEGEEPHPLVTVDRENSFEDLEQFLTQLDWASAHDSTDDTISNSELPCDPLILDEGHIQELEMRVLKEHLKAIVKDIHIAIDQLLSLCLLSFECLNTASSKDLCLSSIEEAFFTPLWHALLALFRYCSPSLQGSYPYESAVQELKLLVTDYCPQKKLECLVRTLRLICACAEDCRCLHEVDATPRTSAIGADDLLPILSFVALQCQCPQLISECAALEEFIHEGYLIGEEGYCLTSMQSALAYVESLHTGEAQLPADTST
uniref:VPS9 domain-containing protein n=1 Tax=Monopterus albus TaxID=43700 RepID=A0A3Q3QKK1_MONAL